MTIPAGHWYAFEALEESVVVVRRYLTPDSAGVSALHSAVGHFVVRRAQGNAVDLRLTRLGPIHPFNKAGWVRVIEEALGAYSGEFSHRFSWDEADYDMVTDVKLVAPLIRTSEAEMARSALFGMCAAIARMMSGQREPRWRITGLQKRDWAALTAYCQEALGFTVYESEHGARGHGGLADVETESD